MSQEVCEKTALMNNKFLNIDYPLLNISTLMRHLKEYYIVILKD